MNELIRWLYLLALAVWLGRSVFFSFVVAPTVFRVLGREDGARLQQALFPRYYLLGLGCAVIGLVGVGWLLFERGFGKGSGIGSLLLLAGLGGIEFWLRQAVAPRMEQLRAAGDAKEQSEWRVLHRLSVQLNLASLVGQLALLWLAVYARLA